MNRRSELILYLGLHKKSINAWTACNTKPNAKVFPVCENKMSQANRQHTCIFLASLEGHWIRNRNYEAHACEHSRGFKSRENPDSPPPPKKKIDKSCVSQHKHIKHLMYFPIKGKASFLYWQLSKELTSHHLNRNNVAFPKLAVWSFFCFFSLVGTKSLFWSLLFWLNYPSRVASQDHYRDFSTIYRSAVC